MELDLGLGLRCVGIGVAWASSEVFSVRSLDVECGLGMCRRRRCLA